MKERACCSRTRTEHEQKLWCFEQEQNGNKKYLEHREREQNKNEKNMRVLSSLKWGASLRWSSSLCCLMQNLDEMTIGKIYLTLLILKMNSSLIKNWFLNLFVGKIVDEWIFHISRWILRWFLHIFWWILHILQIWEFFLVEKGLNKKLVRCF